MTTPHYWHTATKHLSQQCPIMAELIARYEGEFMTARPDGFFTLLRAVVGQQISVKAADAVWLKLTKAVKPLTPETLLRKRDATLRACGLSGQKVAYAKNVARFFVERAAGGHLPSHLDSWAHLNDDEVIAELTAIKGIGTWTAEMFLMFHLTRPDVLPIKDLGLLKGINRHFPTKKVRKPLDYIEVAERWRPYRTVATWYLWRALDPVPVAY